MELSYFRKSTRSFDETVSAARAAVGAAGLTLLAEKPLQGAHMLVACKAEWAERLLAADHRLAGFMPCALYVLEKDGDVLVGTGQPSIIKSLIHSGPLVELAIEADLASKEIIHEAAGVGALTPENVIVYATHTCPYCTKVKDWMDANGIKHSVVYVDEDREAGRRMVEKTGQMGVPVTEVSFGSDAEPALVLGFDEDHLRELLVS